MSIQSRILHSLVTAVAFGLTPGIPIATALTSDPAGGGQPHENHQPGLGLNYLIATSGAYPFQSSGSPDDPDRYLGEITMFAGNYVPQGWAHTNGQALQVSTHNALFSLLGTIYGGNGETTFELPDLRGRSTMNAGQGAGLSNASLGIPVGVDDVTLSLNQMPAHQHPIPSLNSVSGLSGGGLAHSNMKPSMPINYFVPQTRGEVLMAGFNFLPEDTYDANGQVLAWDAGNFGLFGDIGTIYGGNGLLTFGLPDLTGRLAMHEGQGPGLTNRTLGAELGEEYVALTTDTIPVHTHNAADTFSDAGGDLPHENMQPTSTLNYIIATQGDLRPEGDGDTTWTTTNSRNPFYGEVRLFAGNTAPAGWAFADGQTMDVSQNFTLFAILGTTYGGNGETTFNLPDLRGRVPVHVGGSSSTGPLRVWTLGEQDGEESVTLSLSELPSHAHDYTTSPLPGDLNGDGFVGLDDLDIILQNWNQTIPPGNPLADPTGDNFVGLADLDIVLNNWNAGTPPSAAVSSNIPEPASLGLFLGALGLAGPRRRTPAVC